MEKTGGGTIPAARAAPPPKRHRKDFFDMKATGIVRRIDDLGRVVIPKEIRRTMRIREGDPLEIFVDHEGEVVLKKYSPMTALSDFAAEYAASLSQALNTTVLITDRDEVIAVSGGSRRTYLHRPVGPLVEKVMNDRRVLLKNRPGGETTLTEGNGEAEETGLSCYGAAPILPGGDVAGSVVICSAEPGRTMGEVEKKLAETAASFLARQLEQ